MSENVLYFAVGGGGDALAAMIVARLEEAGTERAHFASFAWERKRFDPQLGPRRASEFSGLGRASEAVWYVTPRSRLRRGRSFLPAVANAIGAPIHLLEPWGGARQVATQLVELTRALGIERTVLVDAGGDILARGTEPGLRSPLADAVALAAANALAHDVAVCVVGRGLDGELTSREWREASESVAGGSAGRVQRIDHDIAASLRHVWDWHPSEVTGLLCLAALGYTGDVELRGAGLRVKLDAHAADAHWFPHDRVFSRNQIAQEIAVTDSLWAAERVVRTYLGRGELDDERDALERIRSALSTSTVDVASLRRLEAQLLVYSQSAADSGVAYLTLRRVAEVLRAPARTLDALRSFLRGRHPRRLDPPVWHTSDR